MAAFTLIKHGRGALGLRFLGLGPGFIPKQGIIKLRTLLDKHAFWAHGRSNKKLRALLAGSTVVVSLWQGNRLVGFGRATSDGVYRAVLWDVVVAEDLQGLGLGKQVVQAILDSYSIRNVERVYLMTTKSSDFYQQIGFERVDNQSLLIKKRSNH